MPDVGQPYFEIIDLLLVILMILIIILYIILYKGLGGPKTNG